MDVLQKLGKLQQTPKTDRIPYYELYFPEQRENTDIIRTINKCTMVRNPKSYQRAIEKKIIVFCLEYILEACTLSQD